MLTGRPKTVPELSAEEEAGLRGFSTSRSLPHALVARAKLVRPFGALLGLPLPLGTAAYAVDFDQASGAIAKTFALSTARGGFRRLSYFHNSPSARRELFW
jgi:hypothetical protein